MKEKKNGRKRVIAILAVAAGAALLIGGSTYALWSANAIKDGGTITSGDLNLVAGDVVSSYDVSFDRSDSTVYPVDVVGTDGSPVPLTFNVGQAADVVPLNAGENKVTLKGHFIESLDDWQIVPGDTVAVLFPYTVTLKGDNLVARLTLDTTGLGLINPGMSYYYAIFDADGQQIGTTNKITSDITDYPVALFQANNAGQTQGIDDQYTDPVTGDVVGVPIVDQYNVAENTAVVTLAVFGYFDEDTSNRNYVTGTADASLTCDNADLGTATQCIDSLKDLRATLTQVRWGTTLFPSASPSAEPTTEG